MSIPEARWVNPRRLILLFLALLALALLSYLLVAGLEVRRSALSALGHLRRIETLARGDPRVLFSAQSLASLRYELAGLRADLEALRHRVGTDLFLLSHLGWLPSIGPNLRAAPHLLQMGIGLSAAGEAVCLGAEPLLELLEREEDVAQIGEELLLTLAAHQAVWLSAQQAIESAAAARACFSDKGLHPSVGRLVGLLDRYLPWLRAGLAGAVAAPDLLGADGPRRYLILAQNSDELRPTGGFISGVGLLVLDRGQIAGLSFQDSYQVDDLRNKEYPDPPPALAEQMGIQLWVFRDANWFADFPTSARACMDLYRLGQGIAVNGVIAADLTALQRIVAAVGPLKLSRYGSEVNGSNVLELIRSYWAPPPEASRSPQAWEEWRKSEALPWEERSKEWQEWFLRRKEFMPDLVNAVMERVLAEPDSLDLAGLVSTIRQVLDEKHVLVYLDSPQGQQMLRVLNWDGALLAPNHDHLLVVDANVGYNKANPNIKERIVYRVDLRDAAAPSAELTLYYENASRREIERCVKDAHYEPTYDLMTQQCYWDYVRVYAPRGARLLASQSPEAVSALEESAEHTVWATSFVIAPGQEIQITFRYALPASVLWGKGERVYNLLVQKQPGTEAWPLQVDVQLPVGRQSRACKGGRTIAAEPEPAIVREGLIRFQTDLRTDQSFTVCFER